jgi:hypothetical protein
MPTKKKITTKKTMKGKGLASMYNKIKSGISQLDESLRRIKPLSMADNYFGKDLRKAVIDSVVPFGSHFNDLYDRGIEEGYGKKRKKKFVMK